MGLINTILDIVFPNYCLSCRKNGEILCLKCLSILQIAQRETERWIYPLYDYRNPITKKAIHLLKYKNKKSLSHVFASVLYERIIEELSDLIPLENFKDPILIPIPLSPKRRRERGFNQSELLCQRLMHLDKQFNNFKLENKILIKDKETVHQAQIKNRSVRLKNLIQSFKVINGEKIKNRNIILIDDVTTTGATLTEAKKTLKKAGAKRIIAFTIAH